MDFALNIMNVAPKIMIFAPQMMDFARQTAVRSGAPEDPQHAAGQRRTERHRFPGAMLLVHSCLLFSGFTARFLVSAYFLSSFSGE